MVRMNAQSFGSRTLWIVKVNHLRDRARVEPARDEGLLKGSPMVADVVLQGSLPSPLFYRSSSRNRRTMRLNLVSFILTVVGVRYLR